LKILVVDDHALVREGLSQVLRDLAEKVEVLQAGNCLQAFALAQIHADLDLVLLDYHLPDLNGLQALELFVDRHPGIPIVFLSGADSAPLMREAMESGAAGFITKSGQSDALLDALRQVLAGGLCMPAELRTEMSVYAKDGSASRTTKTPLTPRQDLVLSCLLDGLSNKEIADVLNVSEETIKTHITAILRYFGVQNRTQAVVAAARAGYRAAISK
jgi:DNA-binding NarL/FixJ family response regulator